MNILCNVHIHTTPSLLGDNSKAARRRRKREPSSSNRRHIAVAHSARLKSHKQQSGDWIYSLIIEKHTELDTVGLKSRTVAVTVLLLPPHHARGDGMHRTPACLNQINASITCSAHFTCRCNPGSWRAPALSSPSGHLPSAFSPVTRKQRHARLFLLNLSI